jgi:hypothetical protein
VWIGKSLPEKPTFTGSPISTKGAIPAQGTRFFSMALTSPTLNWAQVDDISRSALRLYIYGFAKYVDDFSIFGEHTVGFCGVYNPQGYNPPSTPGPPIDECDNPNYVFYN